MAIATDNGKLAVMEWDLDWEPGLPLSPGAFGQDDQQQLLWGFPEILWEENVVEAVIATPGGTFKRSIGGRIFARIASRLFKRPPASRVFKGYPRMAAILITELPIDTNESRAFIFDYSQCDEAKAGETISSATVPPVSGVTIGTPTVLTEETNFVPAGKGVKVTISVASATTYDLECRALFSGGATVVAKGRLIGE